MDGGDWVTLIVSLVTIMVSVFGAHELVRKHDKKKDAGTLFAKVHSDMQAYYSAFNDFVAAVFFSDLKKHREEDDVPGIDPNNPVILGIIRFNEKQSILKGNCFLVSLMLGRKESQEVITAIQDYIDCVEKIYNKWRQQKDTAEDKINVPQDNLIIACTPTT